MKKVISILLIVSLILFVGCSNNKNDLQENANTGNDIAKDESVGDDDYPNKPIEIIVPYGAGGSTDVTARLFASKVSQFLPNNVPVVVVNKAGGGGSVGIQEMVNKKHDGYTFAITTGNTPIVLNPLTQKINYKTEDLQPLMQLVNIPQCINVKAGSRWETPEDLIDEIRENPGKIKVGITAVGGAQQIFLNDIADELNSEFTYVPFGGSAELVTALLQETIDVRVGTPANYDPTQAVALFTVAEDGVALYPEIPLLSDYGVNVTREFYIALVAPKGVPENRLAIIEEAFKKAFEDPDLIESFEKAEYQLQYKSKEQVEKMIEEEIEMSIPQLKKLGLLLNE